MWLVAASFCVLFCFVAGVVLSRPRPAPLPSSTPHDDFAAPHKPLVVERHSGTPSVDPLEPAPAETSALVYWVAFDNTSLYAGQGLDKQVLQKLSLGTQVSLLKEEDDWTEVEVVGGQAGWVERKNILDHPPPGVSRNVQADALPTLEAYFKALNGKDLGKAYDLLSFDFKRELAFSTFSQGYAGLEEVAMRVIRVQTISNDSRLFFVEELCLEKPKAKAYKGEYTVILERNQWRIAQAVLTEVDPKTLAPFPAQAVSTKPAFSDPTPDPDEENFEEQP